MRRRDFDAFCRTTPAHFTSDRSVDLRLDRAEPRNAHVMAGLESAAGVDRACGRPRPDELTGILRDEIGAVGPVRVRDDDLTQHAVLLSRLLRNEAAVVAI